MFCKFLGMKLCEISRIECNMRHKCETYILSFFTECTFLFGAIVVC